MNTKGEPLRSTENPLAVPKSIDYQGKIVEPLEHHGEAFEDRMKSFGDQRPRSENIRKSNGNQRISIENPKEPFQIHVNSFDTHPKSRETK